jgi:cytoskeleton protein RodZ
MPEIGETLRETRMRRRIDITEVEAATKIRAKYLRALENEEWDLLPGPTFVKTFLRTYAEYLDLDPRMLVEEYRQRYERPSTQDLTPFGPGLGGQRRRRRAPRRSPAGPAVVLLGGLLILLATLYVLGSLGDDETEAPNVVATATPTATATSAATPRKGGSERKPKPPPSRVSLKLTATDTVFVCLVDASGKPVINAINLMKGESTKTLRSRYFRANFGNANVRMIVGGREYRAEDIGQPIGYEFRPGKRPKRLSERVRVRLCA